MKFSPLLKNVWAAVLVLGLPLALHGRIIRQHPYQERTDKADLVIIAKPLGTKDTGKKRLIEGHSVIEVLTELEIKVVFKGDPQLRKITLRHFIYRPDHPTLISPPSLAEFDEKSWKHFLLFLQKDTDGNYSPAFGQTDPMGLAVVEVLGSGE